jgi:spore coat protein U-like protein
MTGRLTIGLLLLAICGLRLTAQGSCKISNTQAVFFQSYSSATVQTTGQVQFHCDKGTAYAVGLSAGTTPGATVTNRMLQRNSDGTTLGYQLFNNASYTTNWGNSAATNWLTGSGTGSDQSIPIFAQIPGAEAFFSTSNGTNFGDTITVTLSGNFITDTRTVQVTLQQVSPGCGIGANSLNFGNYSGAMLDATTTLQIACTSGTSYNVGLNAGIGYGATVNIRKMTGPAGALLNYGIFSNSTRSHNWGNTVGADTVSGTGNNAIQNLIVYGEIPAGQSVGTGSYTDTIIATLTY